MTPPSNDRRLTAAFALLDGATWTAGIQYLENLFAALRSLGDSQRPQIALLLPTDARPDSYAPLVPYIDKLLHAPPRARANFWQRQIIRIRKRLGARFEPESSLESYLREHQVDCVFTFNDIERLKGIALLTWIPDFQHVHMPEMFSAEVIGTRNQFYSRIADQADRVILSSKSVFDDFGHFAPHAIAKSRIVSFVPHVPTDLYDLDPRRVCDLYHLPDRFIYLPNQFWKHKNHGTVVQALALAKERCPEMTVVCSGDTSDSRNPSYFSELLTTISTSGLRDNFIILGLVPHNHVFQFMRQSLFVLQPSLFEGLSTTIEEAKAVGKSTMLSDIPVHREQSPRKAVFFDPRDCADVARKLEQLWREKSLGPDFELEAEARSILSRRVAKYAESFMSIVREAVFDKALA